MQTITTSTIVFSPRSIANGQGRWIGYAADIDGFEEGMTIEAVESLLDDPNAEVTEDLTVYSTRDEAIEREIVEPIEAGGGSADDFNIDAIADEIVHSVGQGTYYGLVAFPMKELHRPRVDAFWSVVADYDESDV